MPLDFLERQLARRDEAAQAAEEHDTRTLAAVIDDVRAEARDLTATLGVTLDERRAFAEARTVVRELRFLHKVADDLAELESALDEPAGS
jgi:DnaJ-domain-containing protein 1